MKGMEWSTGTIIIRTALDSTLKRCYLSCYPPQIKTAESFWTAAWDGRYCTLRFIWQQKDWSVKRQKHRHPLGSLYSNLDKWLQAIGLGKRAHYNVEIKSRGQAWQMRCDNKWEESKMTLKLCYSEPQGKWQHCQQKWRRASFGGYTVS